MTDYTGNARRRPRVFYGWWVVAAASVLGMFGNGSISQGFPRFFTPIRTDLGLTNTQMSLVFSLARAEGSAGGPLVGWVVDRFGARPMILAGGLLAGVSTILLSRADTYWELLVLFSFLISMGKSAGFGQTLMAAVNQWFIRRRAVAMSTLMTSFAGGGAFVVLLLDWGIRGIGWRDTVFWTGVFIVLLTLPIAFIIRSRPEDVGMRPDGDPPPDAAASGNAPGAPGRALRETGFTFRQAIRTRTYWLIMVGAIIRVSATNGMLVHIFPIMELRGVPEREASMWVAAMFFLGIPLRFVMGVTTDKFRGNILLAAGMVVGAVGMGGLWIGPGLPGLLLFVVGIAIVEGITSVNWLMLSDYYGRARFATLMGFMSLFMNVGMFISPYAAGRVADLTGSYYIILAVFTPLYLVSALAFLLSTRPSPPPSSRRRWLGAEAGAGAHRPPAPAAPAATGGAGN